MNGDVNRAEILKLVETGQLAVAEAAAKLASPSRPKLALTTPEGKSRWFHVRVSYLDTNRTKVTVNLPMAWVQVGLSIGSHCVPELDGLDWQEIATALNDETTGRLVEVEDLEKGERVEIYVD
jgi:hypothetical protein